ncbi:hypothetical protein AURDEDRAFT_158417 [Auricularia subglabra TFB-10046 SS5]|nr:hypothetical protein AURDEDRAFT_158417 [Auricularia subglabra TFB-10046 SS5]
MTTPSAAMQMLDIACEISSCLSLAEACLAKGICRTWLQAVKHRLVISFSAKRVAGQFFSDHTTFHSLMATRDLILTGLPVVDMFDERHSSIRAGALEILVEAPMGADVHRYMTSDGYEQYTDDMTRDGLPRSYVDASIFARQWYLAADPRNIEQVTRFVKRTANSDDWRVVDVVWTRSTPALSVIRSDNTLKMTFLTWNKAYSVFPVESLLLRRAIGLGLAGASSTTSEHKERGYDVDISTYGPVAGERRIGDKRCCVFDIKDIDAAGEESTYDWTMNGFAVCYPSQDFSIPGRRGNDIACISSAPLSHGSLNSWSYSASSGFRLHFIEYIRDLCATHGMAWRYRRTGETTNDRLPAIYESYTRALAAKAYHALEEPTTESGLDEDGAPSPVESPLPLEAID